MKVLALITWAPNATMEDFAPLRITEQFHVWSSYRSGKLREIYHQPDPVVVTFIYEVDDIEEARRDIEDLPMMKAGLLVCQQIIKLNPWHGFEQLFDKNVFPTR